MFHRQCSLLVSLGGTTDGAIDSTNFGNQSHHIDGSDKHALCSLLAAKHKGSADLDDGEKALVRAYLHSPGTLHPRRTLDQHHYHIIDTTSRDRHQVVSRWARRRDDKRTIS